VTSAAGRSRPAGAGEGEGEGTGRRVDKPWGHELIWAETDRYAGKILVIETGRRLSLQRHVRKDESILVLEGRLRIHLEDDAGEVGIADLGPGEHRRVPAGRIHRYEAIERCRLVEVSTPELDDVIRLDDDFGREGTSEA
jgi:mannose-6-phosphate isomerase-like protein (cupin superfamily)